MKKISLKVATEDLPKTLQSLNRNNITISEECTIFIDGSPETINKIKAMRLDDLVVDKAILKAVPEIENDNLALSLFDMDIRKFISDKKALGGLNSGALMYVGFIIDEIYENKNALVGIKGIGIPTANLIESSVAEIFLKQNLPHPFAAVEYYKPILKKWRETFSPK